MQARRHGGITAALALLLSASPALGQGFAPRGDATCSANLSAADIVATVLALTTPNTCGNDDCDRSGVIDAADVDCAARCLFGTCPVPPHAPQVSAILPDSAPEIVPGSVVRIPVAALGDPEANKRVTVDGREAEVIEQSAAELLVALPADLATGPVEIVIIDGDLAGPPFTVDLAPPVPLGMPDTFDGTLVLLDTALDRLLAIDLEEVFGDETALVRDELARFRDELAMLRATLALSEAERIQLDAAFDASGLPEELRALIAELDGLAGVADGIGAPAGTLAVRAVQTTARTIKVVRGVAQASGAVLSAPALGVLAGGTAIIGGILLAASDPFTPLIFDLTYLNAEVAARDLPTGDGYVNVRGARFDAFTTSLEIQAAGGTFDAGVGTAVDDQLRFQLPDDVGFCGKVTFRLSRPGGFRSNPVAARVQPELLRVPALSNSGRVVNALVRGANGCFGTAWFRGVTTASTRLGHESARSALLAVPYVIPGTYEVHLTVEDVRSLDEEDMLMQVGNPLTGLVLTCPATIEVPDTPVTGSADGAIAAPLTVVPTCQVAVLPDGEVRPQPTVFTWRSSRSGRAAIQASTATAVSALTARDVGTTTITAALETTVGPHTVLATSSPVEVAVVDRARPRVTIASGSPALVEPGGTISVTLTASDNTKLGVVRLLASGDAIAGDATQESLECLGEKTCTATFTVSLKEDGFTQRTLTLRGEAVDAGANTAQSNTLTFTINEDTACPRVTIHQPANGSTVNAGETFLVVATGTDDQPGDVGVARFRYSAVGETLATAVNQELPLPAPQAAPTLRFNVTTKPPDELAEGTNRTITISVEALDAAMPPNTCGPQTIAVEVIGIFDRCEGGIEVDNPAGYIDEAFTITVALTGEGADEITRVTSINPGGRFDLQSIGGGVYEVTLFYQGTGSFTLTFIALDAQGTERCSGSIGLESLGPESDEGAAAARQEVPAGARR